MCTLFRVCRERHGDIELHERSDLMANGDVLVCAFDIETTKFPLQLPNSDYDRIFMISYMMDGEGFLISNREIVSEAIDDFEYTPKPEFPGPFTVFNEPDEKALLQRFFSHMRERQPGIYVTFNGDSFDFPFVENRAKAHSLSMLHEIGLECDTSGECHSRSLVHMDALAWVNRDSYLPQVRKLAIADCILGYACEVIMLAMLAFLACRGAAVSKLLPRLSWVSIRLKSSQKKCSLLRKKSPRRWLLTQSQMHCAHTTFI